MIRILFENRSAIMAISSIFNNGLQRLMALLFPADLVHILDILYLRLLHNLPLLGIDTVPDKGQDSTFFVFIINTHFSIFWLILGFYFFIFLLPVVFAEDESVDMGHTARLTWNSDVVQILKERTSVGVDHPLSVEFEGFDRLDFKVRSLFGGQDHEVEGAQGPAFVRHNELVVDSIIVEQMD